MKAKYPNIESLKKDLEKMFLKILNDSSLIRLYLASSNGQSIDIDRDFTKAFMKESPPKKVIVHKHGDKGAAHECDIFGSDVSFKDVICLGAVPMKVLDELESKKITFQNGRCRIEKRFAIHSVPYIVAVPCK
uniref:Uncharacterized protein n=1 Tax=candidate division CPR3 bacterium TaxID=2268181 RepID=A0A7C4M087_UNCC3